MNRCFKLSIIAILCLSLFACHAINNTPKHNSLPIESSLKKNSNMTKLVLWHYYSGMQKRAFDELVGKFNSTVGFEEKIYIEVRGIGNIPELTHELLAAASQSMGIQALPDIFSAYPDMASSIDKMCTLLDFNSYLLDEERRQYIDPFIEEGYFDNSDALKIFPVAKSTEVFVLNKTYWDKFALKTGCTYSDLSTWESLQETAKKYYSYTDSLTTKPHDGRALFGRDALANYFVVGSKQLGFPIFDTHFDRANLDRFTMKKLWDNYYVPYILGYYALDSKYASDEIKTGNIIALVTSSSGLSYISDEVVYNDYRDNSQKIDVIVLPVPIFEGSKPIQIQQGAGFSVIDSDNDQKNLAALTFLKWLTSSENNLALAKQGMYFPVNKQAFSDFGDYLNKENTILSCADLLNESYVIMQELVKNDVLYRPATIKNGYMIRTLVEDQFKAIIKKDRADFVLRLNKGETYNEIVKNWDFEARFDVFYEELLQNINRLQDLYMSRN